MVLFMDKDKSTMSEYTLAKPGPVIGKAGLFGLWNMILLLILVFFAEVSALKADGLFDFQMKLAEKGNAEAQFKVGEMYETGFGVKKSMKEAEIWILKAAAQGHETAGFKLLYWDMKKNGNKGDNKAKYRALLNKAESGEGQAMYYVGKMYANGVGTRRNYDKALDWLNKATFIGVLEAEREAVLVREEKQKALAKARRDDEKRKAKLEEKKRKDAEAARLAEKDKKKQQDMQAKLAEQAEEESRAADLRRREAEQQAAAAAAAATAAREKKRQELLKQRKVEKEKKASFESDPCLGKSARFLSTCK